MNPEQIVNIIMLMSTSIFLIGYFTACLVMLFVENLIQAMSIIKLMKYLREKKLTQEYADWKYKNTKQWFFLKPKK